MAKVDEMVRLIRKLFVIRDDAYGTRAINSDNVWRVKSVLTDELLLAHLYGKTPIGAYSLSLDGTTKWICVDVDEDNFADVRALNLRCQHYGFPAYIEISKRRGFHVWSFFQNRVPAYKARAVLRSLLAEVDMQGTEVFPKQDALRENGFGNFVWLPLFGYLSDDGLARRGRTIFVDEHNVPYSDQFKFLSHIHFISESELDEVIQINDLLADEACARGDGLRSRRDPKVQDNGKMDSFFAPPCLRRILMEGAAKGLRNESCFRLSILLSRTGIPEDLGWAMLRHWNSKNRPPLPVKELEKAFQQGYSGQYRTYGCANLEAYCNDDCPIYRYRKDRGWK